MKSYEEWLNETTFEPEQQGESPYAGIGRNITKDRLEKIKNLIQGIEKQIYGPSGGTGFRDIFKGTFGFVPLIKSDPKLAEKLGKSLDRFWSEFSVLASARWPQD